jgi:hypothetical protein
MKGKFSKFTHGEVLTVLKNYEEFSSGRFIEASKKNPAEGRTPGRNVVATFENPCLIAAEIWSRVSSCGKHGEIIKHRFGMNPNSIPISTRRLCRTRGIKLDEFYFILHNVSWYCTGKNRRKEAYDESGKIDFANRPGQILEKVL